MRQGIFFHDNIRIIPGLILVLVALSGCIPGGMGSGQTTAVPLDLTFASPNGYVLWSTPGSIQDRALEMAVQQDGKIILSGYTNDTRQKDILILRFLPDGTPDSTFGTGGSVIYAGGAGKDDYGFGLTLDNEGKILIAGREHTGNETDILLIRCNQDGSPDDSFGESGTVYYTGPGKGTESARGIVVQNDGKIVITGELKTSTNKEMAALRYYPNGTLDKEFGSSGLFTLPNPGERESYGFGISLDQVERILLTGSVSDNGKNSIGLVRLLPDGMVDPSFGDQGIALYPGSQVGPDYGNWVSVQPDGKILVTGAVTDQEGSFDIILIRYNQDGTLDNSFGDNGVFLLENQGYDYAWGQTVMPDGRIIIAGTTTRFGMETPILVRLTPEGKPDPTYGENGILTFETIGIGRLYAVNADNGGNITASGYITDDGRDFSLLIKMAGDP